MAAKLRGDEIFAVISQVDPEQDPEPDRVTEHFDHLLKFIILLSSDSYPATLSVNASMAL